MFRQIGLSTKWTSLIALNVTYPCIAENSSQLALNINHSLMVQDCFILLQNININMPSH